MKPSLQTEPKCTPISTWKRHFSEYGPQNASRPQTVRNGSTARLVRKLGVNYLETCTGIWQNNFISDEHFLEIHRNIFEILCTIHCLFFFGYVFLPYFTNVSIISQKQTGEYGASPQFEKNDIIVLASPHHPNCRHILFVFVFCTISFTEMYRCWLNLHFR